jgi:hypothetical protein
LQLCPFASLREIIYTSTLNNEKQETRNEQPSTPNPKRQTTEQIQAGSGKK